MVAGSRSKAPRRPAEESRRLVADAALDLFGVHGYTHTSITDIAAKSGVAETVIYRLFGTKAELFEEVIFGQLVEVIVGWLNDYSSEPGSLTTLESARAYVESVYTIISRNRGQILALLAAEAFEPAFAGDKLPATRFDQVLERVATAAAKDYEFRQWRNVDVEMVTRLTFSMIFSIAMFPQKVLPRGRKRPSEESLIEEMATYMLYGVISRPE